MKPSFDRRNVVSIIIPCRNERIYLQQCLQGVFSQEITTAELEVIVADGMSDDGTREILADFQLRHLGLRIVDNMARITSTGLNAAIRAAHGTVIIRMDAHTIYAPDYVQACLAVLLETGADNVGGAARTQATTYLQKAIATAYHSPFSVGGARFHDEDYEGDLDTVTYGCWRRETFERFGYFDEELIRNQDDEHNLRIIRGGGRIWQSPRIQSWYSPRKSIPALFSQYAQYGYWKVRVIQKHRLPASIRHLVPGGFVATLLALFALAPFFILARWLLASGLGLYLCANLVASLITCRRPALWKYLPVMPPVFAAYHFGYGWGFLRGVIDFIVLNKRGRKTFEKITR